MRKKSVATKLVVNPDLATTSSCDELHTFTDSHLLNETGSDAKKSYNDVDTPADQPVFSTDATGNIVLSDGTPVVQPAGVEETQGFSVQFDLQDGVLPRKSFASTFQLGSVDTVRCTSCAVRISPFTCAMHPHLSVIVCKRCLKFYGKGEFARDIDGKDENCRWCGDGGDLICCDSCSNTFCKSCIKRNLGRSFLQDIENLNIDDSWNCLICSPSILVPLQQECLEVFERIKSLKDQSRKRAETKRNRLPLPITPKTTGKLATQVPVRSTHDSPKISNSYSSNNSNSCEWYLKNTSIAEILNQISSIRPPIVHSVIQSLRFCVETFSNDIKRVETNLSRARTPEEVQATVRSFQSIYRFHLLGRIANVVSRVNTDLKTKTLTSSSQSISELTDTIDLTDDLESTGRSTNGHNSIETQLTSPVPACVPKRKRESAANSFSSVFSTKKRRKTIVNSPDNAKSLPLPSTSSTVDEVAAKQTTEVSDTPIYTISTTGESPKENAEKTSETLECANASISKEMLCGS